MFPHNITKSDFVSVDQKAYAIFANIVDKIGIPIRTARTVDMKDPKYSINKTIVGKDGIKRKTKLLTPEGVQLLINKVKNKANIDMPKFYEMYLEINKVRESGDYKVVIEENHECDYMYLLHIKDDKYKFGITSNLNNRLNTHKKDLEYGEALITYPCANKTIAANAESKFKDYLASNGVLTRLKGKITKEEHREIFITDNIEKFKVAFMNILQEESNKYNDKHPLAENLRIESIKETNKHNEIILQKKKEETVHMAYEISNGSVKVFNETIKQLLDRIEMLENIVRRHDIDIDILKNMGAEPQVKEVVRERPFNRPVPKVDIQMDLVNKFVAECIIPDAASEMTNKKVFARMLTVPYMECFKEYENENKRELFLALRSAIKTIHGIDCVVVDNKDKWRGFNLNCVPLEEFINTQCALVDGVEESNELFLKSYIAYCNYTQRIPFNSAEVANELKRLGIRQGGKHPTTTGCYLRDNSLTTFINDCCENVVDYSTPWMVFMDNYNIHCTNNNLTVYAPKSVKLILPTIGYRRDKGNNTGCKVIVGLRIKGLIDKQPPIPIVKKAKHGINVYDFVNDCLHNLPGKATKRYTISSLIKEYMGVEYNCIEIQRLTDEVIVFCGGNAGDKKLNNYVHKNPQIADFIDKYVDKDKEGITLNTDVIDIFSAYYEPIDSKTLTRELGYVGYDTHKCTEKGSKKTYYKLTLKE